MGENLWVAVGNLGEVRFCDENWEKKKKKKKD